MKRKSTSKDAREPRADTYHRVFNADGGRVRGLWTKNGRYYAQLDANDGRQYSYHLEHENTVPQAILARQALKLKQQSEAGLLPPGGAEKEGPKEGPTSGTSLTDAVVRYQDDRDTLQKKDKATAKREDSGLKFWKSRFGIMDLAEISATTLGEFTKWRKKTHQVGGRAIDIDIRSLRHVLNFARTEGVLPEDQPRLNWKKLAARPAKDDLLTPAQMDQFCQAAMLAPEALELIDPRVRHLRAAQAISGQSFYDYLRLLQYSGARAEEACLQHWDNVTWSRIAEKDGDGGPDLKKGDKIPGNLFFPGKNAKAGGGRSAEDRWVDFHPDLERHLKAMHQRRDKSSDWMFPGKNEGEPINRFYKQLYRVKKNLRAKWETSAPKSELEKEQWFDRVSFQWFRHYFISHAVMAGINFKTIAYWVSHRDGGVLIGRLYGHLDNTHSRQMAAKMAAHLERRR